MGLQLGAGFQADDKILVSPANQLRQIAGPGKETVIVHGLRLQGVYKELSDPIVAGDTILKFENIMTFIFIDQVLDLLPLYPQVFYKIVRFAFDDARVVFPLDYQK